MENHNGCRQWASSRPKAVFLLVHGLGAHAGRWEAMADFLLKRGISSYAPEFPDPDGHLQKIEAVSRAIKSENPGLKIFLAGESLGALEAFLVSVRKPSDFAGVILISPAFSSRIRIPFLESLKILLALAHNRNKRFKVPFDSAMCTRDPEYVSKMNSDNREHRSASAILLAKIIAWQAQARISAGRMKAPALFLSALDDKLVDPQATRRIFRALGARDKTIVEYPGMYHALSIDIGKEKVFEDIARWVEARI